MKKIILTTLLSASALIASDLYTDTYMSRSGIVSPHIDTGISNMVSGETLMKKKIYFHTSVYFNAEGLTQESVDKLRRLHDYIHSHSVKNYYISVIGHTSGYEDSNYMVQLNAWSTFWQNIGKKSIPRSELAAQVNRRILAVYNHLYEKEGINKAKMYTENRLARDPISTEATVEGKLINTRVDVALFY